MALFLSACVYGAEETAQSTGRNGKPLEPAPAYASVETTRTAENGHAKPADEDLPPYDYTIDNGLYATITAFSTFEEPKIKNDDELKLKIDGFKKDVRARVMWQDKPAPMVVLLLGLATRSKAPLARYWQQTMYDAGCHVLTFDSVFLPAFSTRSMHGVAGNVRAEALVVGKIVEAVMKDKKAKGKVTQVGLVGGSYGGILALNYAQLAAAGEISVRPDRVLAISPPVSMKAAAQILDEFHREHRWNYTLAELGSDLLDHKPVAAGQPIPFTEGEMKAGIAAAFRIDLRDVVESNDRNYKLKQLPGAGQWDNQYRLDTANTWTFERFITDMSYPYWRGQDAKISLDEFWANGECSNLLRNVPPGVRVVLAADDPLDRPSDVTRLQSETSADTLTVLPRGGHMGFVGTKWCKAVMQRLFK